MAKKTGHMVYMFLGSDSRVGSLFTSLIPLCVNRVTGTKPKLDAGSLPCGWYKDFINFWGERVFSLVGRLEIFTV